MFDFFTLTRWVLSRLAVLPRWAKRSIMAGIDASAFLLSAWLAFYLRLGNWAVDLQSFGIFILTGLPIAFLIMWFAGVYKAIFRFVGAGMMSTLFRAFIVYSAIILTIFGLSGIPGVPRTVSGIQPLIFFALVAGSRTIAGFILLELLGRRFDVEDLNVVLIYGAGQAGQQLARSLHAEADFRMAGYIDDDTRLVGQALNGDRIYAPEALKDVIRKTGANTILLALPGIGRARRREIVNRLSQFEVEVRVLPAMSQIMGGAVSYSDVRPVHIDDLLGRESVAPNEVLLSRNAFQKTVLITGAGGSIGSELSRQIARLKPVKVVLVEMTEHALYRIEDELKCIRTEEGFDFEIVAELVNVTSRTSVERLFSTYRPDTVFHAAAYKHVPLVEANVLAGVRNNIFGTYYCAQAAIKNKTGHFILVSTDKAVRPTNIMGTTKRVCELILQALSATKPDTRFAMVRFGNVLGSSGSVVPRFQAQIQEGGPVTLTHRKITRFFMTIPEASQLVIQAGSMARGGEVYLLDMGKPVEIHELAKTMIQLSGLSVKDEQNPDGDIEITEVGLRPGEKLFEELLIDASAQPTNHPQIMQAVERMIPLEELEQALGKLKDAVDDGDKSEVLSCLRALVPEYDPSGKQHQIGSASDTADVG